jgi:hypothetical protein
MNRVVNVVKMQFVNRLTYVWVPLIVLIGSLVLSVAIFAMIPYDGVKAGGGTFAPLWYFLAVGVQALTRTFPFSQAMSVTRREYFFGTIAAAAVTSVMLSVIFVIGGLIEEATRGWGVNGYVFHLDWLWTGGPWGALLVFFVIAMLFFISGFWAATIFKRFGALWLTVVMVGIGVLFVGAIFIIARLDAWEPVFTSIATRSSLDMSLWGLVLGAVLALGSFLTLRRALP